MGRRGFASISSANVMAAIMVGVALFAMVGIVFWRTMTTPVQVDEKMVKAQAACESTGGKWLSGVLHSNGSCDCGIMGMYSRESGCTSAQNVESQKFLDDLAIIEKFEKQWPTLQSQIPIKPTLGATSWFIDDFQFVVSPALVSNRLFFAAFEDGHKVGAAAYRHWTSEDRFQVLNFYQDEFPFTQERWEQIVQQYAGPGFTVSTYTKQVVRGTEIVNFSTWTKVPENKFVRALINNEKLFVVESNGGRCVYGGCWRRDTLYRDGKFVRETGASATAVEVYLNQENMDAITRSIDGANFSEINSKNFVGICPTSYDGQQNIYTFYVSDTATVVDSCKTAINYDSGLFTAVNNTINAAATRIERKNL